MTDRLRLTCSDVDDLAGLHVLDALGAAEALEVATHLADHPDRHPLFRELAGVTPFLAESVEAVAPPPELRDRVMARVAVTPQLGRPAVPALPVVAPAVPPALPSPVSAGPSAPPAPVSLEAARERRARRNPLWGVLAAAAVLAIVVLAGWNVLLQQRTTEADGRVAILAEAVAAAARPGSVVVPMEGIETAAGASGYAVFPVDGTGYIVLTDLPAIAADRDWQAWTIVDGDSPASAGLMDTGRDGIAVVDGVPRVPGISIVALTVEPDGGSEQPTTTPTVVGQLEAPLAWVGGFLALR